MDQERWHHKERTSPGISRDPEIRKLTGAQRKSTTKKLPLQSLSESLPNVIKTLYFEIK